GARRRRAGPQARAALPRPGRDPRRVGRWAVPRGLAPAHRLSALVECGYTTGPPVERARRSRARGVAAGARPQALAGVFTPARLISSGSQSVSVRATQTVAVRSP